MGSSKLVQGFAGKRLLKVEEAAVYLGLSARTLYNRCAPKASNPFPVRAKRVGKALRFDLRDLDAYIDSLSLDSQFSAPEIS
jgi:predicted DNA-binding transcriptional regulator AlpA